MLFPFDLFVSILRQGLTVHVAQASLELAIFLSQPPSSEVIVAATLLDLETFPWAKRIVNLGLHLGTG